MIKPLVQHLIIVVLLLLPSSALLQAESAGFLRAQLENGLRVVIVKNTLAPVVTTEMNYLVGADETPSGFPGMAHAQEHMMFRGSPGLSAAQLSTIIASLGGEFNANTQQTVTQYFFTVPADDLDIALNVEAVRMRGILDTDPLWSEERGAIEQEVAQDLSEPSYILFTRLLKGLYAGTPYERDGLGTRESFQKTTGAMLKKFFDTWYVPNNAVLVIVGNVDPDKTLARVKELFGPIPRRPVPARAAIKLRPLKPEMIRLETDMAFGLAVIAYRLPGYDSPDYAAGQILAEALNSRLAGLYNLVVDGKALQAGFDSTPLPKAASGYAVAAFPKGGDGAALLTEMKAVIAGYRKDGIPADLVEAAKRHEIADAEFQKNSVPGLASLWSAAIAVEGRTSPDDDIAAVKKVTPADVNRVGREFLLNDRAITAILTPKPAGARVSMKESRGAESFTPRQVEPVDVPSWAKKVFASPAMPPAPPSPADMTLSNGIRLIVLPSNVSDTVSITGTVRNNPFLQEPAGKEGVSQLMETLFSYGTTSFNRVEFRKAVDAIAADLSVGTDFSLRVPADRFQRGVELLADNILRPAFPEQAFTVLKQQTAAAVQGERESPSYQMHHELQKALYGSADPLVREATPESISALTLVDVRSYYGSVFRPDMTFIVVTGKITPEQARAVIEGAFGSWKTAGPKPQVDPAPAPLNKPGSAFVDDDSRVQDEVSLAQVVGINRLHPDYYPLQVGNHVLSGAFYATRLYRDLREKAGLVYAVESAMQIGKTRSLFAVFYACDPPNNATARARVEGDIRAMQTTLITPEELRQARALLVRKVPLSRASEENTAAQLLKLACDDLPLDEPQRGAKRYLAITAEDVKAAFSKWIRPGDFVQVTTGPGQK